MKELVRKLRKSQTEAEQILWVELRNRKLKGFRFNRQHPVRVSQYNRVKYFSADFYCAKKKLIIELDGKIHENQKEYDEMRTALMNEKGIRVVRFSNHDILQNTDKVLEEIEIFLQGPSLCAVAGG